MALIGIDLGTSNSAAAVLRGGHPVVIPGQDGLSPGGKAFPSCVALTADGELLVGELARRQATANPEGTATAFKRRMGQRENLHLRDQVFAPEQLTAFLLRKIRTDAEAFLGEMVDKAVVTVPAGFDDNQRAATRDACRIAGLELMGLLNEPTAAALAYGLERQGQALRIVVIDLGGGMLDVTILNLDKGLLAVRATAGDTHLGGVDMSRRLFGQQAGRFQAATGVDVHHDRKAAARLTEALEAAKIELTTRLTAHVSLPYLALVHGEPHHLEQDIKRNELERLVRPLIERCRGPVEQALHDARLTPRDIDRVIFVGGPTCMPAVRSYFEKLFVRKGEKGVDPMSCVAAGAAIHAGILAGKLPGLAVQDVTPHTLGVVTLGGVATPLIARNTPLPVSRKEIFTTAADRQGSLTIHVFQGERPVLVDNTSLGEFNLDNLPAGPQGEPQIEVSFDIDGNGILAVAATDLASGSAPPVRVSASPRLTEDEKKRMVEEAIRYAAIGRKRREDAERLSAAEAVCYDAERLLANFGDKLADDVKQALGQALGAAREALADRNQGRLAERVETLKNVLEEASTALYTRALGGGRSLHAWPEIGAANGKPRPSGAGPQGRVIGEDDDDYR